MKRLHPFEGFFVFFLIVGIFFLLAQYRPPLSVLQGMLLSHLGVFFLLPLFYTLLRGVSLKEIFPLRWAGFRVIFAGIFGGLGALLTGFAIIDIFLRHLLPIPEEVLKELVEIVRSQTHAEAVLLFALIPAVFEEWLYRGFLYHSLRWRWGVIPSAILSSLLFGMSHLQLMDDWMRGMTTAWLGFVLALMVERFSSLIPAMIGHFFVNYSVVLVVFLENPTLTGLEPAGPLISYSFLIFGAMMLFITFFVVKPFKRR